jgi:hypothetical protein
MIGTGEYISRADAIEAMYKDAEAHPNHSFWVSQFEALMDIPAADVRPVVRGKWEPSEKYKGYVSCSICHDCYVEPEWVTKLKWGFCPNCGADMRGEADEKA